MVEHQPAVMRPSEDVIKEVRERTDRVMVAFSTGKDSIAAYLAIKDHFPLIEPYYLYSIPGMRFIENSLDYYERHLFGGKRIRRYPHPGFIRMLNNLVFQPPEHCGIIEAAEFPDLNYEDLNEWIAADLGWNLEQAFVATGVRAADSPMRRTHFVKHGAINYTTRTFYPVYDWNKERLIHAIESAQIKLPIDYKWFGRSFDGLDLRFIFQIRRHAPDDYARMLEWFPLAELEIKRYEFAQAAKLAEARGA
jgi:hypothetical protein